MAKRTKRQATREHPSSGLLFKNLALHPYLKEILQKYRKTIISVLVFSFFINILMLAIPLYLLQIYSRVLPNHSQDTLLLLTGMVMVALITMAALEALRSAVLTKLGSWFEGQLSEHLLSGSLNRSLSKPSASINILRDLETLRNVLAGPALISFLDLPWTPIYMLVLFFLHPVLGFIVLAGAVVLTMLAILNEYATRDLVKASDKSQKASLSTAESYLRNAGVIQAMGLQQNLLQRWKTHHHHAMALNAETQAKAGRIRSTVKLVRLMVQLAVIGAAAWLILSGNLTAGATMAGMLLMRRAISPLETSIASWKSVLSAREAFKRINARLAYASTLTPAPAMPTPRPPLSVERVGYKHPGEQRPQFHRVSFVVQPGEVIALTGPTAAGKSTLSKLLVGIQRPSSGEIKLDGYSIAHWDAGQLGKHLGYLPQNVELFAGTIRENIARMSQGDLDKVIEAAKLAGVHELIQRFPKGYDTEIGEDGGHLSGGQKQRIALARAVYDYPCLVVLDEPDANLDDEGRAALVMAIQRLKRKGTMVVLISHQPTILKFVDRTLQLKNGQLKEVGKHPKTRSSKKAGSGQSSRSRSHKRGHSHA